MCYESQEKNAHFVAYFAIVYSFVSMILECIKQYEQWFLVFYIVTSCVVILAAIVLLLGIKYNKKFLVMVWIVVAIVCGVLFIVANIILLTKLSETADIVNTSVKLAFHPALFAVWLWISIVYYGTL
ncbi:uncharacterized protein LOC108156577 [Drosophila miranda]|uniref:uncharacterized protein LOC108156577 n=1 Tax=Drosophila miranda TaxID=7229 RepID=UPI0007E5D2EA|nr:uncharacterized protein LOC108156577 [Drosophila miranda]